MVQTAVDVCNLAILKMGGETIDAIDETTPIGAYCQAQYPQAKAWCLSKYRWSFASAIVQLTQLATPPAGCPAPYAFQPPKGLVGAIHAYRTAANPRQGEDAQGMLVNNPGGEPDIYIAAHTSVVFAEFTAGIPENRWPAWFTEFVATVFAMGLSAGPGQNASLANTLRQAAFGSPDQNMEGGLYGQARNEDSRNAPKREAFAWWDQGELVNARWGYGYPWGGNFMDFPFVGLPGSFGPPTFINFPEDQGG